MRIYLLLGAGFSRTWGGWLASEVFEYLIGHSAIREHPDVLKQLWLSQTTPGGGGFEGALSVFQSQYHGANDAERRPLQAIQDAAVDAIRTMDRDLLSFDDNFNLSELAHQGLNDFLSRFDAIFSLNQDTVLEKRYISTEYASLSRRRWRGCFTPGVARFRHQPGVSDVPERIQIENTSISRDFDGMQPVFKLHGSWNWFSPVEDQLVVMGGQKSFAISQSPLLSSYHEVFSSSLNDNDARLVIIGYGFGDPHINDVIENASKSGLRLFIIDPRGYELLGGAKGPKDDITAMERALMGSSRRGLSEIFGQNDIEYNKVMRFLN
jgi:hypothetical protein